MIKSELIEKIAQKRKLSVIDATHAVECFFSVLSSSLSKGERVELRGFGVFSTRTHKAKLGRNPKTGENIQIPEKKVPFFKAGKALHDALNNK